MRCCARCCASGGEPDRSPVGDAFQSTVIIGSAHCTVLEVQNAVLLDFFQAPTGTHRSWTLARSGDSGAIEARFFEIR